MNTKIEGGHVAKRSRIWLGWNVLMLLAFLLFLLLQFNDPDPIRWIAIYGAAVVACGLELAGRGRGLLPALTAAAAVGWAAVLAPVVFTHDVRLADLYTDMQMERAGVEEAREMVGLLLVAGWMIVLAWTAHRRAGRRAPERGRVPHGAR